MDDLMWLNGAGTNDNSEFPNDIQRWETGWIAQSDGIEVRMAQDKSTGMYEIALNKPERKIWGDRVHYHLLSTYRAIVKKQYRVAVPCRWLKQAVNYHAKHNDEKPFALTFKIVWGSRITIESYGGGDWRDAEWTSSAESTLISYSLTSWGKNPNETLYGEYHYDPRRLNKILTGFTQGTIVLYFPLRRGSPMVLSGTFGTTDINIRAMLCGLK